MEEFWKIIEIYIVTGAFLTLLFFCILTAFYVPTSFHLVEMKKFIDNNGNLKNYKFPFKKLISNLYTNEYLIFRVPSKIKYFKYYEFPEFEKNANRIIRYFKIYRILIPSILFFVLTIFIAMLMNLVK